MEWVAQQPCTPSRTVTARGEVRHGCEGEPPFKRGRETTSTSGSGNAWNSSDGDEGMGLCEESTAFPSSGRSLHSDTDETMAVNLPRAPWAEGNPAPPCGPPAFHPFTSSFSGQTHSHPSMDVIRKADHYEVQLDLPGQCREHVCLQLRRRVLYLSVARPGQVCGANDAFSTTVQLPHDVDAQRVEADMSHGLLRVRLPRGAVRSMSDSGGSFESLTGSHPLHVEHLNW